MGVLRRGGRWYVKWKDASGAWVRKATTARTKTEAQALWHAYSERAQRQRDGLSPRAVDTGLTLWGLMLWWVEKRCPKASQRRAESLLRTTIERRKIGSTPLLAINGERLTAFFVELREDYSPATINQLRALIRSAFNQARKATLWVGANPVADTQKLENHQKPRPTLRADQVRALLARVRPPWRSFFALGVMAGLRKGEICGLRKSDYDPNARTLVVASSYDAGTTKTKRTDVIPVSGELAAFLDEALKTPGPWLCPREDGGQRNENCSPEDNLRSAMRRAGIIDGWTHKCRRCVKRGSEPTSWTHPDDAKRRCPTCGFTLWPVARPTELRFHDLRHTFATLLLRAGVPVQHVMRLMRHSNIGTTVNTYGHLMTEDLRTFTNAIFPGPQPVQQPAENQAKTTA